MKGASDLSGASIFFLGFYVFVFRERGREGEKERNMNVRKKHQSSASCIRPDQGPGWQPRHVPLPGIDLATFHIAEQCPAN